MIGFILGIATAYRSFHQQTSMRSVPAVLVVMRVPVLSSLRRNLLLSVPAGVRRRAANGLLVAAARFMAPIGQAQAKPAPTSLYRLQTDCSLNGTTQRCMVEAFDGRDATVYRTSAKAETLSFRLIDQPERRAAQLWDARSNAWVGLDALSLDFTKNQLCINRQQLCMVNPNFFASIRDDHPNLRSDLIVARFEAKDGRLAAIAWPVTGVVLAVAPVAGGVAPVAAAVAAVPSPGRRRGSIAATADRQGAG